MKVFISSRLDASANKVWALVRRSDTLVYVCRGLLAFSTADKFPEKWQRGTTEVSRLKFLGVLPAWEHAITFEEVDETNMRLVTKEPDGIVTDSVGGASC